MQDSKQSPPYAMRALRASDLPFVYSTWLGWARRSAPWLRLLPDRTFWNDRVGYRAHVEWMLSKSETLIACDVESPELVFGYVVVSPSRAVHMLYTDPSFRRHGIALDLLRSSIGGFGERETTCAINRPAWPVLARRYQLRFDPFADGLAGERFKAWAANWKESCAA